ncbi:MAG: c-type cytochrome [Candidatus Pseudothioglobus sp.]|jgi:cytochrome c553
MKKTIIILATVLLASFSSSIIAAGDAEAGQTKSATCMGCHGLAGNSEIASFPKLAGQGEAYLLKQLQNFKSGERNNAIMAGVASLLSEQDMMDIAAYYSIQTISENSAKGDAKTIELGRKIYVGGKMDTQTTACIACHGPKGLGIPTAGFPSLSAQHADYIAVQLKAFRQYSINEQTGSDDVSRTNEMMVNVAKGLTTVEIEALAQYIAGLH